MSTLSRFHRRMALPLAAFAAAVTLTACSAATPAPAADTQGAAAAVAMADSPQLLTPQHYQDQFAAAGASYQLIDVRTPEEFNSGHIAGAINIPVQELGERLAEISKEQPVILYCRSGNRSSQAAQILDQAGYSGVYDLGGIGAWQQAGFILE